MEHILVQRDRSRRREVRQRNALVVGMETLVHLFLGQRGGGFSRVVQVLLT